MHFLSGAYPRIQDKTFLEVLKIESLNLKPVFDRRCVSVYVASLGVNVIEELKRTLKSPVNIGLYPNLNRVVQMAESQIGVVHSVDARELLSCRQLCSPFGQCSLCNVLRDVVRPGGALQVTTRALEKLMSSIEDVSSTLTCEFKRANWKKSKAIRLELMTLRAVCEAIEPPLADRYRSQEFNLRHLRNYLYKVNSVKRAELIMSKAIPMRLQWLVTRLLTQRSKYNFSNDSLSCIEIKVIRLPLRAFTTVVRFINPFE